MRQFFDDRVLLSNEESVVLYNEVKDLPIIDYHCHLNQHDIRNNARFRDIASLWLGGDHYKWRAMRLCGVDEFYITGNAPSKEKFIKYCEIMPKLMGNPLYYWSHFELKQVFVINLEINKENAEKIYDLANEKLKSLDVTSLLKLFKVEYIATTDDPTSTLEDNGIINGVKVMPTFRADKIFAFDNDYIRTLGNDIHDLEDYKKAIVARLDYFVSKSCKIVDIGFKDFPSQIFDEKRANDAFINRDHMSDMERDGLIGNLFLFLFREFKKRDLMVQLHFAVIRNINTPMFKKVGVDSGFDVMAKEIDIYNLINLLNALSDEEHPTIVLYTLNPNTIAAIANISGAFRNVYIGAAWWFNDSVNGIRRNLDLVSEYAVLGTNLGMLTDSRSFSSYSRFDFFRRILCDFVGDKVNKGEYSLESAKTLVKDICYNNIKKLLGE